jgi:threonine/homoserine/homoserine lactone efflux protein
MQLATFFVVAAVVIVTPGPDTALTIRNTLLGGRLGGVFTAVGAAAGQTTWTVTTAAGVASLLTKSATVFHAVRYVGAVYLALLGIQALQAARKPGGHALGIPLKGPPLLSPRTALRQGLLSNLTNPKMIAFFPALLPQFAPTGSGAVAVLLLLGLMFSTMTLLWLTAYAFAVARAGGLLGSGRVRRLLEAATGAVLLALGVRLATESRW